MNSLPFVPEAQVRAVRDVAVITAVGVVEELVDEALVTHVRRVLVAQATFAFAGVLPGDVSGSVLETGHRIPPGREAAGRRSLPETKIPRIAAGLDAALLLGSSPIVPVSGLALAPCWRSAGCRAVDGPEPSRLS